jgi:hypothetical protein
MYSELTLSRNGILVGGRAFTDSREAVAALRALLAEAPAAWARPAERKGFRTWAGPEGTKIRLRCWPK